MALRAGDKERANAIAIGAAGVEGLGDRRPSPLLDPLLRLERLLPLLLDLDRDLGDPDLGGLLLLGAGVLAGECEYLHLSPKRQ